MNESLDGFDMSDRVSGEMTKDRRTFEWMLVIVVFGMTAVAFQMGGYKLVVLHLFYLPIILSGYFLGRSSAALLAILCALGVTTATAMDPASLAMNFTTLMGGFALAVWAAMLLASAILVGTLCDQRATTVNELHQAYVGVVEVLSKYLQGGHPKIKARSVRIAELSQLVGADLKLPRKQIDDIRVGSLLHALGNVEITTKLIAKAVDTLEASPSEGKQHTFAGTDLVQSLSSVLHGAVPLLVSLDHDMHGDLGLEDDLQPDDAPIGARIIFAVRAYDALAGGGPGEPRTTPRQALRELRNETSQGYDPAVLKSIERVIERADSAATEPAYS